MERVWRLCGWLIVGVLLVEVEGMPTGDWLPMGVRGSAPPGQVRDRKTCMDYLMHYNYMESESDDLFAALQLFQRMANIQQTGEVDNATMVMMNMHRCGVMDNMGMTTKERKSRAKRYDADIRRRWQKRELTWRVNSVAAAGRTPDLDRNVIETVMRRALEVWSDVAGLTFRKVDFPSTVSVDFNIEFFDGVHSSFSYDGPFDGPGRVLAHAFFPNGVETDTVAGDAHFDDAETYTDEQEFGINLFQVAAHEFGHSLGLGHSTIEEALMAPFYRGYQSNFRLHPDDIAGIQYLYGANSGRPDVTMRPYVTNPNEPTCPGNNIDAVVQANDGGTGNIRTFFFQGSRVWERLPSQIVDGFPRSISSVFQGLPNDIDAGFYQNGGNTYFFKGADCYIYNGLQFVRRTPIRTQFPGLENNIDSAFIWSGNGRLYFTKGDQYYRFSFYYNSVDAGYPRPLSVWGLKDANGNDLPRVTAAFQWTRYRRTYFFFNDQYTRFDDNNFSPDVGTAQDPYPRPNAFWWFGCGSQSSLVQEDNNAMSKVIPSAVLLTLSAFLTLFL